MCISKTNATCRKFYTYASIYALSITKPLEYVIHQYKLNYYNYLRNLPEIQIVKQAYNKQVRLHNTYQKHSYKLWISNMSELVTQHNITFEDNVNKNTIKHVIQNMDRRIPRSIISSPFAPAQKFVLKWNIS